MGCQMGATSADHNPASLTARRNVTDFAGELRGASGFGRNRRFLRLGERMEAVGIQRDAVLANLEVQVRAGRAPSLAKFAKTLTLKYDVADLDDHLRQMRVAGGQTIVMIDIDHLAVFGMNLGSRNDAARRGENT